MAQTYQGSPGGDPMSLLKLPHAGHEHRRSIVPAQVDAQFIGSLESFPATCPQGLFNQNGRTRLLLCGSQEPLQEFRLFILHGRAMKVLFLLYEDSVGSGDRRDRGSLVTARLQPSE